MIPHSESEETVLFLHIPKAAGTTLSRIAERHYSASSQYCLGPAAQAAIQHFNELPREKRGHYRYIAGHFPYGVHEQIPGPTAYLTLLRHPLTRTASFYHFVRQQPNHPITEKMSANQKNTLVGFLEECREPAFDNGQTRLLAGDWGHIPFGECDENLLDRAIENLKQIEVVGLCEAFIPSLLLAADRFQWNRIGFHTLNQTPNHPGQKIEPNADQALRRLNRFDLRLYEVAKKRFENDLVKMGSDFQGKISNFDQNHPPPPRWMETLDRLRQKTPRQLGKYVLNRIRSGML